MKILSLRLRGFIGVKKGMGLDEVTLDFSNISGLVAFAGPNGRGKTTILDNLHPFRQLASRNRSLQHHVFLRDSFRELEFEYQGDHYRTLIKLDADSERSEGFVWKNGEPQVDGKVSSYDRYITDLFGTPALFFNSVFCAQNAEKISDMTTGELKKLFAEFLRLDRLIEYETTAKHAGNLLDCKISDADREIERAREAAAGKDEAVAKLAETRAAISQDEARRAELVESIAREEKALEIAREAARKNESARQRKTDLESDLDRRKSDLDAERKLGDGELATLRGKVSAIMRELKEVEGLLQRKDEITAAAATVDRLEREIDQKNERIERLRSESSAAREDYEKVSGKKYAAEKSLAALENDRRLKDLEFKITSCRDRMADLGKKDPACQSTTCSFIVGALQAEKELPGLESELGELKAGIESEKQKYQASIDDLGREMKALTQRHGEIKAEIQRLTGEVSPLKQQLAAARTLAADLPKIEAANARKNDLERRRDELNQEGMTLKKAWETRIASSEAAIRQVEGMIAEANRAIEPEVDEKINGIAGRIEKLRGDAARIEEGLNVYRGSLPHLETQIAEKTAAEARLRELSSRRLALVSETSDWAYLRAACSKDGLRALEIDSVAPIISGYANDLLTRTFGPQYAVKFRTQNDDGREVLDILAIREDGTEVLLDNLSGGERVWSLKALRLAMTLIAKEKSGKNFLTALSDEEDGALDAENARSFIGLYRAFMQAGGFDTCFYITHKPECVSMADHVLRFQKGGISIA